MKLLLDQNISFRVVKKLKNHFSIVEGVRECGLNNKDDRTIREFCRQNSYTIITFDEDLYNLTTLYDYFLSTDESCLAIYQSSTVNL